MISGEGTTTIRRSAAEVMEFVLDFRRYAEADTKIRRVFEMEREGNHGRVRYSAWFWKLPVPTVVHEWTLVPHSRLEVRSTRRDGALERFEGLFTCEETSEGTRVLHRETFVFIPAVAPLIDRLFGSWLARQVRDEVTLLKRALERDASPPSGSREPDTPDRARR